MKMLHCMPGHTLVYCKFSFSDPQSSISITEPSEDSPAVQGSPGYLKKLWVSPMVECSTQGCANSDQTNFVSIKCPIVRYKTIVQVFQEECS